MRYVNVDAGFPRHRKVSKLMKRLGMDRVTTVGHIVLLWCKVAEERETGVLRGWSDDEIAEAAHWHGKPRAFVSALHFAGLLDRKKNRPARVHNFRKRNRAIFNARKRSREYREGVTSRSRDGDVTRTSAYTPSSSSGSGSERKHTVASRAPTPTGENEPGGKERTGDRPPSGPWYEVDYQLHKAGDTWQGRDGVGRRIVDDGGSRWLQIQQENGSWRTKVKLKQAEPGMVAAYWKAGKLNGAT